MNETPQNSSEGADGFNPTGAIVFHVILLSVLFLVGMVTNINFVRKNRRFLRKGGKISDINLLICILSISNILYLLDIIPSIMYYINDVSLVVRSMRGFSCNVFLLHSYFTRFSVIYFLVAISRDVDILARNTVECNKSNRFQMFFEAFTVWSIYLIITSLVIAFSHVAASGLCLQSLALRVIKENTTLIFFVALIAFNVAASIRARKWSTNNPVTFHIIRQSWKICFLYVLCWLPAIVMDLSYPPSSHPDFWRHLSQDLSFASFALFPFVWRVEPQESHANLMEHELM